MTAIRAFFLGLRELVTLEHAEQRALALGQEERSRRVRYLRAARARRAASRKLANPVAAVILLRDALALALRPTHSDDEVFDTTLALSAALATHPEAAEAERRVVDWLQQTAPLALDELSFAQAELVRSSFEDCLAIVLGGVETRSVLAVRALRIGRLVAVALLVTWLAATFVRSKWLVHDVAIGKTVTSSPLLAESPSPDHVVDGRTRGTFGIATMTVEHPFITVDLGDPYAVEQVRVVNRGDGWFDDCLPLILAVSNDGLRFDEVARRTEHFDQWTVPLGGRALRFVRVSMPERGYIALNEIEVYAR
jgi:hypothetical protein